jgi:hypothetical protein
MSEKDALQRAADEARKVARMAREFGGVLDDYAKYLTQRNWQVRTEELRLSALNKLGSINNGLATCNKWIVESAKFAAAQAPEQIITSEVSETREVIAVGKPRAFRIKKKENRK